MWLFRDTSRRLVDAVGERTVSWALAILRWLSPNGRAPLDSWSFSRVSIRKMARTKLTARMCAGELAVASRQSRESSDESEEEDGKPRAKEENIGPDVMYRENAEASIDGDVGGVGEDDLEDEDGDDGENCAEANEEFGQNVDGVGDTEIDQRDSEHGDGNDAVAGKDVEHNGGVLEAPQAPDVANQDRREVQQAHEVPQARNVAAAAAANDPPDNPPIAQEQEGGGVQEVEERGPAFTNFWIRDQVKWHQANRGHDDWKKPVLMIFV